MIRQLVWPCHHHKFSFDSVSVCLVCLVCLPLCLELLYLPVRLPDLFACPVLVGWLGCLHVSAVAAAAAVLLHDLLVL